jgi:hypothetical protein
MNAINTFGDEYFFLSNFYECPITFDGLTFTSAEAAFQAQKCLDKKEKTRFTEMTPSEARSFGRRVRLRKDWDAARLSLMREILEAKFSQNGDLKQKLLLTDDAYLVEGNTWGDRFWGQVNGFGANHLGRLLMELREIYKEQEKEGFYDSTKG